MEGIWNLKDLLASHSGPEFENIISDLNSKVNAFEKKRSKLNNNISESEFNLMLKELEEINLIESRLSAYGELWFSQDTTNQEAKSYLSRIDALLADVSNKILFFSLWFKNIDDSLAEKLIKDSGKNHYFLEHMRKLKAHSLQEKEEQIINLKDITGIEAFNKLYDIITSSFVFPLKVNGQRKKLGVSELITHAKGSNEKLREESYKALWKVYKKNKDVLGEIYFNVVRDWNNECLKLRNYSSPINVRNKSNDLPDEAINTMLETCRQNRHLFQEYFELKAKALGLKKMSRYHIYAPLEKDDSKISFEDASKIVLENFNQFSPQIGALAKKVFDTNHIHWALGKNKRAGAYCMGISPKDTPYVLLNYTQTSDDVITMAHELGHAVHDLLVSDRTIFTFHPPLPLAETASVFGELIVTSALLKKENSPKLKKHLIAGKLDDIYATVIRQTYFILFEKIAHEMIPKNATINEISKEYKKQLKEQFGKIKVPKDFENEWIYIPHIFHTPFYCYAYAFGNLLTLSLYKMYLEEGKSFVPKYIKFLSYGGSESPQKILQELGINITQKEFWQKGFDVIKEMLDEFKKL